MAKEKSVYVCSNCGQESPNGLGNVPVVENGIRM
jgi:predicted ATP-dependent serine protease